MKTVLIIALTLIAVGVVYNYAPTATTKVAERSAHVVKATSSAAYHAATEK